MKHSIANIIDRFGRSFRVRELDVLYESLSVSQFRRSRRHKIRKFAEDIFQNVNDLPQGLCKIFIMVTIQIVINFTMKEHFALRAAGIALH